MHKLIRIIESNLNPLRLFIRSFVITSKSRILGVVKFNLKILFTKLLIPRNWIQRTVLVDSFSLTQRISINFIVHFISLKSQINETRLIGFLYFFLRIYFLFAQPFNQLVKPELMNETPFFLFFKGLARTNMPFEVIYFESHRNITQYLDWEKRDQTLKPNKAHEMH